MVFAVICGIISLAALVISIRSFQEKGFLFNNAYIWASREEREKLDKKPHYRQTAVVFAMICGVFACMAAEILLETGWLLAVEGVLVAAMLVYAIKSSIRKRAPEKNQQKIRSAGTDRILYMGEGHSMAAESGSGLAVTKMSYWP